MKTSRHLIACVAMLVCATQASTKPALPEPLGYRIIFPSVQLKPYEQIESFRVFVPCGHIQSIVGIPFDWNVEVIRMISGEEELRASAGHGISYIKSMESFRGVIRVEAMESSCFSVRAEITAVFDDDRIIKLSREQLKLVP